MSSHHEDPFRESARHFKQIGWAFVAMIVLVTAAGFAVYVREPTTSLRPTRVQQISQDTAVVDTLLVTTRGLE